MTGFIDQERRREDAWTTAALVTMLALMACTLLGGSAYAVAQNLGRGLAATVGLGGMVGAGGLIAVIVYLLVNPLNDRPTPVYAGQTNDYSTLAIAAFVTAFFTSVVGIVLGHLALADIRRTGKRGHGLAVTALVVGYTLLAVVAALWMLVFIFLAS